MWDTLVGILRPSTSSLAAAVRLVFNKTCCIEQSPPLSSPAPHSFPLQCDSLRGDQLLTQGKRSEHVQVQYSRAQLFAVTPLRLTSDLVSRLARCQ